MSEVWSTQAWKLLPLVFIYVACKFHATAAVVLSYGQISQTCRQLNYGFPCSGGSVAAGEARHYDGLLCLTTSRPFCYMRELLSGARA